jgi:DNA-binding NtrC family response regulator
MVIGWVWLRRRRHGFGAVEDAPEPAALRCIVGQSIATQAVKERIKRFAPLDSPVLIEGESGTGKELVADALVALSTRADRPYQKINMAAVQESLLLSELFGHTKGAFSGASAPRQGLFRSVDGGTLVLDEIGETPKSLQAAILRAIEQGEVRAIGADRVENINVRVIASTNRDLKKEVAAGRFRQDLYQRLQALQIKIPPLRDRLEDVRPLALNFAKRIASSQKKTKIRWSEDIVAKLQRYDWRKGNVRELRNVIEQAVAFTDDGGALSDNIHLPALEARPHTLAERMALYEREIIQDELTVGQPHEEVARRLGVDTATLWRKRKRHGLDGLERCLTGRCDLE